jgi:hypothetical protein
MNNEHQIPAIQPALNLSREPSVRSGAFCDDWGELGDNIDPQCLHLIAPSNISSRQYGQIILLFYLFVFMTSVSELFERFKNALMKSATTMIIKASAILAMRYIAIS